MGIRPAGPHNRPGPCHDERTPVSDVDLIQLVQPLGSQSHGSTVLGSYTLFLLDNELITQLLWQ